MKIVETKQELVGMFHKACDIGEDNCLRANRLSHEVDVLRRAIWRATIRLRAGQAEQARQTLEKVLKKDFSK